MPRIQKYETDNQISDSDVLLGSDGDNSNITEEIYYK